MIVKVTKCFAYIAQPPYTVPPSGENGSKNIKAETNNQATYQCKNVCTYRNCKCVATSEL